MMIAALTGCGGAGSPLPTVDLSPVRASSCLEGVVVAGGPESDRSARSRIRLEVEADASLTGLERDMLESLPVEPVTRVRVCGTRRADPEGGTVLDVETLRLISVGGEPAFTGVVMGGGGVWRLEPASPAEGPEPVSLSGAEVPLAPWWGERVWVAGPMRGDDLVVRRIGPLDPTPLSNGARRGRVRELPDSRGPVR